MSSLGLNQFNSIRNQNNRLLDYVFASNELDFHICRSNDFIVSEDVHHPTIMLTFNFDLNINLPTEMIYDFDFKNADYNKLNDKFDLIDNDFLYNCSSIDCAVNSFYNFMFECFLECVPLKCVVLNSSRHPWYDNELRQIRKLTYKLYRTYCISNSSTLT